MILEGLAVFCTALFAGAAAYITFVEHPARLACGTAAALAQWRPSYKRAAAMQASLAVVGSVSAVLAYLLSGDPLLLAAGLSLHAVVPFTLLVVLPTNNQLLDPARDAASEATAGLLRRWGRLHAVRTVMALVALLILVVHFVGEF